MIEQAKYEKVGIRHSLRSRETREDYAVLSELCVLNRSEAVIDLLHNYGISKLLIYVIPYADHGALYRVESIIPKGDKAVVSVARISRQRGKIRLGAEIDAHIGGIGFA